MTYIVRSFIIVDKIHYFSSIRKVHLSTNKQIEQFEGFNDVL